LVHILDQNLHQITLTIFKRKRGKEVQKIKCIFLVEL
jgi:hypothetical protein